MNAHLGGGGSGVTDDQDEFLAPLRGGTNVALNTIVERFTQRSPVTVMVRRTLEHALSSQWIDEVFEAQRDKQYTRELLFSSVVDLMGLVALGLRPSLHAAAQSAPDLTVSLAALYDKVNRTEPQVVRALVQGSAERLLPVVRPMKKQEPWAAGYQVRVLDGNHLPASEKRLKPLRNFRGAALPGQSLVVYAPEMGLVVDVLPAEDAHAQERALTGPVLERVRGGAVAGGQKLQHESDFASGGGEESGLHHSRAWSVAQSDRAGREARSGTRADRKSVRAGSARGGGGAVGAETD
ncbi:Mobile element protein [Cystobacter fuscus DSM 2262]|uniref:Mobile element protein n=1 Tax=Cystobacter fuscus (strain ATCC 25194 / DSM 2262 / NBRC 100088 / M29) TaxID=1242864 RepID=S9P8Z3_CYSF2|nr:Mobile element protein [Cystobacter fuscus DSM 2262]